VASEGFTRLMPAHFYENLGFTKIVKFEPVVWFGVLRFGSSIMGLVALEVTRRRVNLEDQAAVFRGLVVLYGLLWLSVLVFAIADDFWLGLFAASSVIACSRAYTPLRIAWLNQNIESSVRATVLSFSGLVTSLGQIVGGPITGGVATVFNLRAAMFTSFLALAPGLGLYGAILRLRPVKEPENERSQVV
jgi:MFS family permease